MLRSLLALAALLIGTPAAAQITATLPVTCNASGSNCVQATPVTNPDGTTVGGGGGTPTGPAGTPNTAVVTVQGIAGGTAQAVSAASLPLPTGAAMDTTLGTLSAKLPASLGIKTATGSLSIAPASDARFATTNVAGFSGNNPTYRVSGTGYGAYTSPTELITIVGSATKTVVILSLSVQIQSTTSTLQTLYFIKRTSPNTGGTATQPTIVSLDSTNPAPTAVVNLYTAAPTVGTSAGNILIALLASAVLTSGPGTVTIGTANSVVDFRQGITLRGTSESFSLNYNGAALSPGFYMTYVIEFVEI